MEDRTHTQDQLAVIEGLKLLRRANRWGFAPLTEAQMQSPEVEAYLQRGLDENPTADAQLEKDITTAIYLAVKRSKWKPGWSAKQLAYHAVEELRAARLTTLYHSGRIDAKRYKNECENNYVLNTLSVARSIKRRWGRRAIKVGITTGLLVAGAPYAAALAGAGMLVWALIPKKHKQKIKEKVRSVATAALNVVHKGLASLKKKGRQIVEKVATTVQNVIETGRRIAPLVVEAVGDFIDTVKEKTQKAKEKVKQTTRKVKDKVKSWFGL